MNKKERSRPGMRLGTKMLIAFLGLSVISLVLFGWIGNNALVDLGKHSAETSDSLGMRATNDSVAALQAMGESMIEQQAHDIAKQLEIYVESHPNLTALDLQNDSEFREIAIQPIGETGYTVVVDADSGVHYFHPNPDLVGTDTHVFEQSAPSVWAIINQTIGSHDDSSGYFEWEGRQKYMAVTVVNATTADNRTVFVAATTYIDEFTRPMVETRNSIVNDTIESNAHIEERISSTQASFAIALVAILALVAVTSIVLSREITQPIRTLGRGAQAIGKGDLDHKVEVHTGDELEELAHGFNQMAADLKRHIKMVERTAREKERIEKELEIARQIQKSFLPLKAPDVPGYQIAGTNISAREVGGDFYDFIELGDDKTGIVVADVSGKGVPAAIFMALSKTLVRANAKKTLDPVEALREANAVIVDESHSGMFVTLFYAILDSKEHKLTYINAGHNPPLLLKGEGHEIKILKAKGIPMGVMDDMNLESKEIPIDDNDLLFLYTDGVTEAVNENDEEFDIKRLEAILVNEEGNPPDTIIKRIVMEIEQFAGDRPQFDDITMVVLRSEPKGE